MQKLMTLLKSFLILSMLLMASLVTAKTALAADLQIVSGGGYKKPMQAILSAYRQDSGKNVDASYGNMRQILTQAKASSHVSLVIGDQKFLSQTDLFADYQPIGEGKLVIAWAQNSPAIQKPQDLKNPQITRIAQPHAKKAIYGRAASEWIKSNQLESVLEETLMQSATVPQVSSYLVAREIDAGFINLTDAIGLKQRIGGYTLLESGYTPIKIVAGIVKGHEADSELKAFIDYLGTEKAKKIFTQYGL